MICDFLATGEFTMNIVQNSDFMFLFKYFVTSLKDFLTYNTTFFVHWEAANPSVKDKYYSRKFLIVWQLNLHRTKGKNRMNYTPIVISQIISYFLVHLISSHNLYCIQQRKNMSMKLHIYERHMRTIKCK